MRFPYVGAGIGLVKDGCLLMGKRADHPFHGLWAVPGGGREKGIDSSELDNAKREFREETGLAFEALDTTELCHWTLRVPFFRWTTFFYQVKELDLEALRPDEFYEIRWVPLEEVLGNAREGEKKHFRPFSKSEVRSLLNYL